MTQASEARRLRKRRRSQTELRRRIAWAGLILGLLLLALAAWSLRSGGAEARAAFNYGPEDIASDRPFQAIHEMSAGPPIPFLPRNGPQPRIALSERYYSFGSLGPKDIVTREFIVANTGDAPLTISRAYTTCGCTTADFSSAVIPPGKVAVVRVVFDAGYHDTAGQTVRRGIIIENNDPNESQAEYWFQASVRRTP